MLICHNTETVKTETVSKSEATTLIREKPAKAMYQEVIIRQQQKEGTLVPEFKPVHLHGP